MITPASEWPDDQARLILETLPVAAYACDFQGRVTYFNRHAAALWGRERKLGDPVDRWMAAALREGRAPTEQEVVIERPDGGRRIATARVEPIRDERGRIQGASAVLIEITDRNRVEAPSRGVEVEERFASFMQHLPAAAWIKDVEGRYTYANAFAERIFGHALSALRGKTDLEIFPEPTAREFRTNDQHAIQSRRAVQTIERLEYGDGSVHESVVAKFPIFDDAGAVAFIGGVAIDVTERRRAVRALRESESMLRALLDHARVCVFAKNLEGRYILANRATVELLGWPDEAFALGKSADELHPPELAELFLAKDREVVASGEAAEVEEVADCADGRRTFLVLKFPLRDANGRVYAVCGIANDISQRKSIEEALRTSEERYRRLAELLPIALYTCTAPDGTISYFNKKATETWGRAPEEGDTDERLFASFKMFRTDGSPLAHADTPMAAALRQGIEIRNEELVVERKDGSRTTIVVNIDPIRDAKGRVVGAVNAFHDISALTAVERALLEEKENLQAVLDTAPVAVLIAQDPQCRRITGNQAAAALLRMPPGSNLSKTGPLEERPTHYRTFKQGRAIEPEQLPVQRAARGEIVSAEEVEIVFDDQHVVHALISARPIFDAAGKPRGAVACVLDVTSLKAAETALKNADRRKDEFLATLGHELRNPLAPIRMGLELMAMLRGDPEKLEQTRSMMERQARQLIRLVDDLLDVSRITRGKIELRKDRIKLTDVIRSAVEASIPFLEEARHELRLDVGREEIFLDADLSRLTQVISNLLNNASKYTPAGGRIALTARREGREAVIRIQDNGVGIPAEMRDRIFDMFTQVKDSQETGHSGLGIGLTLVRVLVEMHGGRIYVESEGIGRGSVFVIQLPVLDVVPPRSPDESSCDPEQAMARRLRVLVVDDNQSAAMTTGRMVELLGHETRTANDGAAAIAVAAEFQPDVVVMDLGMPVLNGYEAAHYMRQQPWGKRMLLVALSGWGQNEHKQRAAEAGFDRHLVKPVEPTALKRLLWEASRSGD